ncbi:Hypothetical predicted protein [Mytilus galloprovincialis]|uniref:C3H1-type domain-containing protein n=1 Tax=Mytilus galloprovincialis TaxID=29158 RepID=A0A8B6GFJ7_MYTGA|nr:Hypothetical predicted protein [Mytilus galloprovincialis]
MGRTTRRTRSPYAAANNRKSTYHSTDGEKVIYRRTGSVNATTQRVPQQQPSPSPELEQVADTVTQRIVPELKDQIANAIEAIQRTLTLCSTPDTDLSGCNSYTKPQISQMNAGKCFLYNNKGRCGRSACRYLHRCFKCGGAHAALLCNLKTTQNSQNEKRKPYESFRSNFRREKSYKNNVNGFRFKSASSVPGSI